MKLRSGKVIGNTGIEPPQKNNFIFRNCIIFILISIFLAINYEKECYELFDTLKKEPIYIFNLIFFLNFPLHYVCAYFIMNNEYLYDLGSDFIDKYGKNIYENYNYSNYNCLSSTF